MAQDLSFFPINPNCQITQIARWVLNFFAEAYLHILNIADKKLQKLDLDGFMVPHHPPECVFVQKEPGLINLILYSSFL